jgi:oligopeptide transport system substrate-binding protein
MALPPADLVIINGKEPESLDPAIISGQADGRIVSSLFEGLTRYNAKTGTAEPGLAESWEISPDGRVYHFRLRPNLQWSDGSPLDAQDLVYSWRRILEPATACKYADNLYSVRNASKFNRGTLTDFEEVGIRHTSPLDIEITLKEATPYFLDICCSPTLGIVPSGPIEQFGDRWLVQPNIPTSGAYRLGSWRLNDRIRLIKNPYYWDHIQVASKKVDILPTGNASTALNLYETGEVDIVWDKDLIPTELVRLLRERPDFHVADFLGTYFLRINTHLEHFKDERVRRALAMSIDKQRLVEKITGAGEPTASHLVPPGIPHYTSPEGLAYSPAAAQELMKAAGYPDGKGFPPVDYLFNSSKLNEQIAVEIQSMWKQHLGIKTNLRQLEWKSYLQDQQNHQYGISRSSWIGDYLDPLTFLDVFKSNNGNNRTGWQDPTFDRLLAKATSGIGTEERMKVLKAAERILTQEALPIIPLYFYLSMEYYDPKQIGGIFPNIRAEHPIRSIRRLSTIGNQASASALARSQKLGNQAAHPKDP